MLLSQEHKQIFIDYLSRQAESCRLMIQQLEKLNHPAVVENEKRKCAAFLIVLKYLTDAETMTIGSSSEPEPERKE